MPIYIVGIESDHGVQAIASTWDRAEAATMAGLHRRGFVATQQSYAEMLLAELPYDQT